FFKKIQKNLQGHFVYALAKLNGKVISAKLILFDQTFSYFFLGGTDSNYFHYYPNVFLQVESINWLREKNISYYFLGGGHGEGDSLFNFKKGFAKSGEYPFHI